MRELVCLVLVSSIAACGPDHGQGGSGDDQGPDAGAAAPVASDPLSGLPTGATQWSAVCARQYGGAISAKFCAGTGPPALTSLADLEALLGLTVVPNPTHQPTINAH